MAYFSGDFNADDGGRPCAGPASLSDGEEQEQIAEFHRQKELEKEDKNNEIGNLKRDVASFRTEFSDFKKSVDAQMCKLDEKLDLVISKLNNNEDTYLPIVDNTVVFDNKIRDGCKSVSSSKLFDLAVRIPLNNKEVIIKKIRYNNDEVVLTITKREVIVKVNYAGESYEVPVFFYGALTDYCYIRGNTSVKKFSLEEEPQQHPWLFVKVFTKYNQDMYNPSTDKYNIRIPYNDFKRFTFKGKQYEVRGEDNKYVATFVNVTPGDHQINGFVNVVNYTKKHVKVFKWNEAKELTIECIWDYFLLS